MTAVDVPVTSEFVYSVLRQAPIFDSVADATLRGLLSGASVYRFQKGRLIYGEGEVLDSYHFVLKGKARVYKHCPGGRHLTITTLFSGDTFGDMALFDGEPLSVSLQAVEETFVIAISRDSFLRFVGNNPAVAGRIASTIGKRFKDAQDRMVDMARGAVENRVKNALRLAHSQFGVVLPLTHQEIADMIGISRESATRVLGRLHQTGVIRIKRGGIVIVNEGELNI